MKILRQALLGILIALASIGLVLGGFSLSMTESTINAQPTDTQTLTPTSSPSLPPLTPSLASPTLTPSLTLTLMFTGTPTLTASLPASPTNCPPRAGWLPYSVKAGDTFALIASHYRISAAELQLANCLLSTGLYPGLIIYVPPLPPTQTPLACGRPSGWVVYIVQPGDTLYHLSVAFGIGVADLQRANCMGTATILRVGQSLFVPPWATRTPSPTFPVLVPSNPAPTNTPGIILPTDTPVVIPTLVPTEAPAPTATDIPVEIPTDTAAPYGPE